MKNLKCFKINRQQYFVDGVEVKDFKSAPDEGKIVFCKLIVLYTDTNKDLWKIITDGKAQCNDCDSFSFEHGRDIAYTRAKREALREIKDIEKRITGKKVMDRINAIENAYDYCNFELTAIGARKNDCEIDECEAAQPDPIKETAMEHLMMLLNTLHKEETCEVERLLAVLEREGFIR